MSSRILSLEEAQNVVQIRIDGLHTWNDRAEIAEWQEVLRYLRNLRMWLDLYPIPDTVKAGLLPAFTGELEVSATE